MSKGNNTVGPVFIVGCDRSGTTLLRLMLDQHSAIAIPNETNLFPMVWDRRDDYGDFTSIWQQHCFVRDLQQHDATSKTKTFSAFDLSVGQAVTALSNTAPCDVASAVNAIFASQAKLHGASIWGDKTPAHVTQIKLIKTLFPNAKFIHLIRDCRDVSLSMRKAGWYNSLQKAAAFWVERVSMGIEDGRKLGERHYLEMRYEELVKEPAQSLQVVCGWLGVSFEEQMLSYHSKASVTLPDAHKDLFELTNIPVQKSRATAWKQKATVAEIHAIERVAETLLRQLGYEIQGRKPNLFSRMVTPLHRIGKKVAQKLSNLGRH